VEELLAPYRVLDLTDEKAMLAGRVMADMGADVIKCEPPWGDDLRHAGPFVDDVPDGERCLAWFDLNRNKRGITINLEIEDGRQLFKELVRKADVLLESYDVGYLDRCGLGYGTLSSINPLLIQTSVTPYGQDGPKASYRTTELTRWASTGVMYCSGDPDRPPNWMAVPQSSIHGSLEAVFATLVALHHRNATGEGQYIDVSMQASCIDALMDTLEMWLFAGIDYRRYSFANVTSNKGIVQSFALPCKDGYCAFFTIGGGLLASSEHLTRVRQIMVDEGMEIPEWFQKMDFVRDYESSVISQELVDQVEGVLKAFLANKTKADVLNMALKHGIIAAPIQSADEVWSDEHLRARGFWQKVEHQRLARQLPYAGAFAILSETPMKIKRPPPALGEHNQEIYGGELGLSPEKLVFLKQVNAI